MSSSHWGCSTIQRNFILTPKGKALTDSSPKHFFERAGQRIMRLPTNPSSTSLRATILPANLASFFTLGVAQRI